MVTTTLLEGSVSVANNQGKQVLIKPGEAALSKGDMLTTEQADIELALAWKNGELQFKRQDLRSIMKVIARWYDVELSFEGDVPPREFTGRIKRASNLGVVLKIFEASNIKFELREDNLGKKTLIIKS
jgi:transmembrane sensor